MATSESDNQLLYIQGPGRCGSTLLEMLLNRHPDCVSLGELDSLHEFSSLTQKTCACGTPVGQCDFWSEVRSLAKEQSHADCTDTRMIRVRSRIGALAYYASLVLGIRVSADAALSSFSHTNSVGLHNSLAITDAAARLSGAKVVIDSSKGASRGKHYYLRRPDRVKIVFLVRDGRAVINSYLRETYDHPWKDPETAIRGWRAHMKRHHLLLASVPRNAKLMVRYEDLCREPEATLGKVLAFAGLEKYDLLETNLDAELHALNGNAKTRTGGATKITFREEWRTRLPQDVIERFDEHAGQVNRSLGYN